MNASETRLIVFTGLPGTGKSSLAEGIGCHLNIPVFAKDWLEATLRRCELGQNEGAGYASYELLTTLALRQLQLGQSAILDSVASFERIRAQWHKLAQDYGAKWCVVECICTDEALHRVRLMGRERNIPGWHELTWAEVERVRGYYEPCTETRLIVDTVHPLEDNVSAILAYIENGLYPPQFGETRKNLSRIT